MTAPAPTASQLAPRSSIGNRIARFLPFSLATTILALMGVQAPGFGPVAAALWLAMTALLILMHPERFADCLVRFWPVLLLPGLAASSTLWSDLPAISLRYGLQLAVTFTVAIFLMHLLGARAFLRALFLAMLAFCALCILHGGQGVSAEGLVLIGLTGSKNQMGYAAHLLLATALAIGLDRDAGRSLRGLAVMGFMLALLILAQVHAATAILISAAGSAFFLVFVLLRVMSTAMRVLVMSGLVLMAVPIALIRPEIDHTTQIFMQDVLKKDEGLTGRKFLWAHADALVAQKPVLGRGYQAFWLGESVEAQGLKEWAGQKDGRGFHFHHSFKQLAVDLGYVGACLLSLMLALGVLSGIVKIWRGITLAELLFLTLFLTYGARFFFELIVSPFSLQTLVFVASLAALWPEASFASAPDRLRKTAPR